MHDLRFAPTVAADPFADTFKADSFCPVVPQSSFIVKRKGFRTGDNSLCLNIYRPKNAKKGDKLPVFVWIHGGAYMMGASNNPYYDGTAFAKDGCTLYITTGGVGGGPTGPQSGQVFSLDTCAAGTKMAKKWVA